MEDILGRIALFHTLFIGCLVGTVVLLLVSIFLFFKLGIGKYSTIKVHNRQLKKRVKFVSDEQKKEKTEKITMNLCDSEKEIGTRILHGENHFFVEREILLIHTNETIE